MAIVRIVVTRVVRASTKFPATLVHTADRTRSTELMLQCYVPAHREIYRFDFAVFRFAT
jgi:hypothetical protein